MRNALRHHRPNRGQWLRIVLVAAVLPASGLIGGNLHLLAAAGLLAGFALVGAVLVAISNATAAGTITAWDDIEQQLLDTLTSDAPIDDRQNRVRALVVRAKNLR